MQANLRESLRSFIDAAAELTRLQRVAILILVILVICGGATAYIRSRPKPVTIHKDSRTTQTDRKASLKVHVAGAVTRPGLYDLEEGSRVSDAIALAGGPAADAMLDEVNLAARLKDGQKIMVPQRGQVASLEGGATAPSGQQTVNVNTADAQLLDSLPGVGPSLAARIVDHRRKNGPFSSLEDLDSVEGIGPSKLESLKDLVTF